MSEDSSRFPMAVILVCIRYRPVSCKFMSSFGFSDVKAKREALKERPPRSHGTTEPLGGVTRCVVMSESWLEYAVHIEQRCTLAPQYNTTRR